MQYQAEQADIEPTEEVSEELDDEEESELHYHDKDTSVETYETTVRESVYKPPSLNDQKVIKLASNCKAKLS